MTGTALYVIAAILLIGWAVGFFYYNAGPAIHILLVLALVSVLIKVVQGRNV
ncbi:MAG TPA: lmo0937 family membrane protein [Prolixibacteraceae bacterium]|nr:lmo0937 family membrane protein [Prolixibacteraceae bacterium]